MSSSSSTTTTSPPQQLPPGWTAHLSSDNIPYYYHAETKVSSWVFPTADTLQPKPSSMLPPKRARSLSAINESLVQASPMRQRAQLEAFRDELLREKFSQRDSVLEPDIEQSLGQWISVSEELGMHDSAKEVSHVLSQNYVGSADLAAILEGWLDMCKPGLGQQTSSAHLREVIRQRFDRSVDALDELLSKHERPPVWLCGLLEKKDWRALFIELASKHRSSPFLAFCVQAIAQAGHHREVVTALSASSHFSVFKETLSEAIFLVLQRAADGEPVDALLQAEDEFLKVADSVIHAHAYTVELLLELEKPARGLSPNARAVLTRLRQRLQAPHQLDPLIRRSPGSLAVAHPELAQLVKRISRGEADLCSPPEVPLHRFYHGDASLPTWPLREKAMLDRMVGSLFQPYRQPALDESTRQRACWVLALAVCDAAPPPPDDLVRGLFAASALCNDEESLSIAKAETIISRDLCALVLPSPTVAMGFLFWAKMVLQHPRFLRSLTFGNVVSALCLVVGKIATAHPAQHQHCFAILQLILEAPRPENVSDANLVNLRKNSLDAMLVLVREGFALPVISFVVAFQTKLDLSLLRHFCKSCLVLVLDEKARDWARSHKVHVALTDLLSTELGKLAAQGGGSDMQLLMSRFREFGRRLAQQQLAPQTAS